MSSYLAGLGLLMLALFLVGCLAGALAWRVWGGKGPSGGG